MSPLILANRWSALIVGAGIFLLVASAGAALSDIGHDKPVPHPGVSPNQAPASALAQPPATVKLVPAGPRRNMVRVQGAGLFLFNGDYRPAGKLNGAIVYRRDASHVLAYHAKRRCWVLATGLDHIAQGNTGKWYYRASAAGAHLIPAREWETVAVIN